MTRKARKHLGAVLALALVGSALLVMAPAQAAAPVSKSFSSNPFVVRHNGNKYTVTVSASTGGEGDFLSVNYTQSKNPSGPTAGNRSLNLSGSTKMTVNDKLSDGRLNPTNSQMGNHGDIDMHWKSTAPLQKSCNGHNRSRKGRFKGKFVFKTGINALGKIEKGKLPGSMFGSDNNCPTPSGNFCPQKGINMGGFEFNPSVSGSKTNGPGNLSAFAFKQLSGGWSQGQSVFGTVPASNVTLDDKEKHGKLQGAAGSFFSGKSTYSSPNAGVSGGTQPCKGGKEYLQQSSTGSFTRGLKADFITGTDPVLKGQGSATRTIVRDA